jgi:lycopene cyclase domain-containing protein
VFAAIILFVIAFIKQIYLNLTSYFKGYIVSLLPFFLVNGVLTKMPVVSYNNSENLSVRIYTIPVEDMVYLLSLLFINFALYETIKYYAERKAQSQDRN